MCTWGWLRAYDLFRNIVMPFHFLQKGYTSDQAGRWILCLPLLPQCCSLCSSAINDNEGNLWKKVEKERGNKQSAWIRREGVSIPSELILSTEPHSIPASFSGLKNCIPPVHRPHGINWVALSTPEKHNLQIQKARNEIRVDTADFVNSVFVDWPLRG